MSSRCKENSNFLVFSLIAVIGLFAVAHSYLDHAVRHPEQPELVWPSGDQAQK